jgi:hypothetical protein
MKTPYMFIFSVKVRKTAYVNKDDIQNVNNYIQENIYIVAAK